MMDRWLQISSSAIVLSGLVAACGNGRDTLNDGSGASGSQGTVTTNKGVGTEPSLSLCDRFCAATGDCYADCQATCETYQGPPCADAGLALVMCIATSYDSANCKATDACQDQYDAFYMCRTSSPPESCTAPTCGVSAASCACTAQCVGGEEKAICDLDPNGTPVCSCYLNGSLFETCEGLPSPDHDPLPTCSLTKGCCMFSNGGG
jgi:hypothetical protein